MLHCSAVASRLFRLISVAVIHLQRQTIHSDIPETNSSLPVNAYPYCRIRRILFQEARKVMDWIVGSPRREDEEMMPRALTMPKRATAGVRGRSCGRENWDSVLARQRFVAAPSPAWLFGLIVVVHIPRQTSWVFIPK
ncbi:hypothetical protein B0H16DRAFT_818294 [Mycena metata]|uniref:Uncharacterized protein n=1 Tax=Mycena metata TaxID=1033252 RepID=A0AAD7DRC7_9AGAR|nr:hypothetical protein B0H16DRAFT_818294 [Mycena metata]